MEHILTSFQSVSPSVIYPAIVLVALFVYWFYTYRFHRKEVEYDFLDPVMIGVGVGILFARLSHVIMHWGVYSSVPFWWSPYERYGDKIYLLRLMPWKLLQVTDGGLVMTGFVFGMSTWFFLYLFSKPREQVLRVVTELGGLYLSLLTFLSFYYLYTEAGVVGRVEIISVAALLFVAVYLAVMRILPKSSISYYTPALLSAILIILQMHTNTDSIWERAMMYAVIAVLGLTLLINMPISPDEKKPTRRAREI